MNMSARSNATGQLAHIDHWIDGEAYFPEGSAASSVFSLATATGVALAEAAIATTQVVDEAVRSVAAAFPKWADTPPIRRVRVLFRYLELLDRERDELARAIPREHGKVFSDAQGEVTRDFYIRQK